MGEKDIQIICLNDLIMPHTMPIAELVTNTQQTSLNNYFFLFFNENSDDNHLRFIIKFPQLINMKKNNNEFKRKMYYNLLLFNQNLFL